MTDDERAFASMVAQGKPASHALKEILPAERIERISQQRLHNLAHQWLAKPQVVNMIQQLQVQAMQAAMDAPQSIVEMSMRAYALAESKRDAHGMIKATAVLADITGLRMANHRRVKREQDALDKLEALEHDQPDQSAPTIGLMQFDDDGAIPPERGGA